MCIKPLNELGSIIANRYQMMATTETAQNFCLRCRLNLKTKFSKTSTTLTMN